VGGTITNLAMDNGQWTTKQREGNQQHTQRTKSNLSKSPRVASTKCAKNKQINRKQKTSKRGNIEDGKRQGGKGKKNQGRSERRGRTKVIPLQMALYARRGNPSRRILNFESRKKIIFKGKKKIRNPI
jgi:hypothetical protein